MKAFETAKESTVSERVKQLAEKIKVCMFCTNLHEQPFAARPMMVQEVDEKGDIWFLSSEASNKNIEVKTDYKVQLIFCDHNIGEYMSVYGSAYIYDGKNIVEKKSKHSVKDWIPEGTNDPNIALIRVIPEDVICWDRETNSNVVLLKKIR
jgi:general stress protein 26